MNNAVESILLTCIVALAAACGDCTGGPGQIEQKTGDALTFETVPLGIPPAAFVKAALELADLKDVEINEKTACRDQVAMAVPDIDDERIVERGKGSHALTSCVVRTNLADQSTTLLEMRGEFIDNRLVRLSFRMKPAELEKLRKRIAARFGKGATLRLSEQLIVEETAQNYQIWQEKGEIWMLSKGATGTARFVHQDLEASEALPEPPKAAKRGEPVSLEDLGIGKLDLNAPMPELNLPDSGVKK